MQELVSNYSISQIIIFIILIALAIKGLIEWIDWANARGKQHYKKQSTISEIQEKIKAQDERMDKMLQSQQKMVKSLEMLMQSDKDQNRNELVKQCQYHVRKGFIDNYSLDCCERLYQHYKDEGGNSYITTVMQKIRNLPVTEEINHEKK